jgi:hypothetical protein
VGISSVGAEEGLGEEKEEHAMRKVRGYGLGLALVFGLSLGTLPLSTYEAAAQLVIDGEECGVNLLAVCSELESETGEGGEATGGNGGRGGNGGFASVHDIANAVAAATSSVTVGDITTGNAFGHNIFVDARGGDDPSAIAGSFSDTGERIFAPGGNAQAGTTGGYGIGADASGGDGGDGGNARGGNSGDSDVDSCNALLLGCFDTVRLGI